MERSNEKKFEKMRNLRFYEETSGGISKSSDTLDF